MLSLEVLVILSSKIVHVHTANRDHIRCQVFAYSLLVRGQNRWKIISPQGPKVAAVT